ncbi:MAG: hypothetical protein NVS3B10_14100 [Polyangiales bacterium]
MSVAGKKTSVERVQTDESLRTEREKADRALAERQVAEESADEVVHRAREHADAVLGAARDRADHRPDDPAAPLGPRATLVHERVIEDQVLRDERALADESLRREREENAHALARLLPLERDKTDRYLLTERARSDDAVSHRDNFLGIVSHDLRNLLAGIVMSAARLSETAPKSEEGEPTVLGTKRIQRYAARMNRLIGDLVDVASIDAGQLALTPEPADSTALIAEAVDMFQAAAIAKGVGLESQIAVPLPAEFDHDRMLQVLANLITNALKFTASGGKIWIGGERLGDELRFTVHDTGAGIPANMLEAIFERFWQVDKNDKRGVGLGLYISKCIVEAHGGRVWAESEHGAGSKLSFTMPATFPTPRGRRGSLVPH